VFIPKCSNKFHDSTGVAFTRHPLFKAASKVTGGAPSVVRQVWCAGGLAHIGGNIVDVLKRV
jgi:hypothetical protein